MPAGERYKDLLDAPGSRAPADAVSIEALAAPLEKGPAAPPRGKEGATTEEGQGRKKWPPPLPRLLTIKSVLALFIIFILVVSDVFANSVVAGFRGAVHGRSPTGLGIVIQGIFLVGFYAVALYFIDAGII
jgi:hypothetical protein